MRALSPTLIVLFVGLAMAPTVHAQVRILPYAGYALHAGLDMERVFSEPRPLDATGGVVVGMGAEIPVLAGRFPFALKVRPTVEVAFVPGATDTIEDPETFEEVGSIDASQRFFQVGGLLVAEFVVPSAPVAPFVGLGLAYARYTATFDEQGDVQVAGNTEVNAWALGPALVGGLRFGEGRVVPVVEARYSFTNPSPSFGSTRDGSEIGNGIAVVVGASIGL